MYVYDIREDTFDKLADDLFARLDKLQEPPRVLVAVGNSGGHVAKAIARRGVLREHPFASLVHVVELGWDAAAKKHQLRDRADEGLVRESPLLLIDSVVNSGTTMLDAVRVVTTLRGKSDKELLSYAVAVRRVADFVPNFFGYSIGANDRVFMPWHGGRPNNRLTPHGVFRSLDESDFERPTMKSKQDFINRSEWTDRWYQARADKDRRVIVCEREDTIASFINFTIDSPAGVLHVDELATDVKHEKRGLGGALLRYAETLARGSYCTRVTLWAHADVQEFYANLGFIVLGRSISCGADGRFHLMERALGSSKNPGIEV
jgi:GNAT superfamily N-acetyltransferase